MNALTYRAVRREHPTRMSRLLSGLKANAGAACFWLGIFVLSVIVGSLEAIQQ